MFVSHAYAIHQVFAKLAEWMRLWNILIVAKLHYTESPLTIIRIVSILNISLIRLKNRRYFSNAYEYEFLGEQLIY